MRIAPILLLALATALPATTAAQGGAPPPSPEPVPGPLGHLSLRVGSRTWGDDLLDDAFGSQTSFGVIWDSRRAPTGFGVELGLFFSTDDASVSDGITTASIDQSLLELMAGGRYTAQVGASDLFLFASAGLDLAYSSVEAELSDGVTTLEADDTDSSVGAYVGAGAYYMLGRRAGLGLDVRKTIGTEDDNLEVDIDHTELAVSLVLSL
ncbi:MAG TPA: outer membrane beta-barrel protein [Planctomycetota bacterium]